MHERQAKDTFSSEKKPVVLILNTQVAQSRVMLWCGLKVSPLAAIKLHSGVGVSGERRGEEEEAEPQQCLHFDVLEGRSLLPWNRRKVGWGGGGRGGRGERKEAVPVLWHQVADSSVSVCVSSHSRDQFALCGTVNTESGKVSKHNPDTCKQQIQRG